MIKKTLLGIAAAFLVYGGAAAVQPSEAQARVSVHIGIGHGGYGYHRYHPRRCYIEHRRVRVHTRSGTRWVVRPVRVCPRYHHHRSWRRY